MEQVEQPKVFEHQEIVTPEDVQRLHSCVASWQVLNEHFVADFLSTEDIRKLIVIELMGRKRPMILDKLASRLLSLQRQQLQQKFSEYVKDYHKRIKH